MNRKYRRFKLAIISFLGPLLVLWYFATPSNAHWADLSVAEIVFDQQDAQITLTFPTALLASADDDRDDRLSEEEVRKHEVAIEEFLGDRLSVRNSKNQKGVLTEVTVVPPNVSATSSHSTLELYYFWEEPIAGFHINYNLFLPGVPTAHCLATIVKEGEVYSYVFTPQNQNFSLTSEPAWLSNSGVLAAIAVSFVWGGMHAMSPGHGKTIVGAYLAGSRATAKQAVFLGLTTTIAHTTGVFVLGLATLLASQLIVPEQLYPWLSLLSGLMVVAIGLKLLVSRIRGFQKDDRIPHHHDHSYEPHDHHHLTTEDKVTWRGLLALGISGGLVPCPSALVLLLTTVALGRVGFGLMLVFVFSLGLAGTLTGLGLLFVSARRLFEKLPNRVKLMKVLPVFSALFIALLGLGIAVGAIAQLGIVTL